MAAHQFIDISSWQPTSIDWPAYVEWAKTYVDDAGKIHHDGLARVSLRASEFLNKEDAHYQEYRAGFIAAGGDMIIHYAYVYPQHANAIDEANWLFKIVGPLADRRHDVLMLDFEEQVPQATGVWAAAWLLRIEELYAGRLPTLYASDSFIRSRLQGVPELARFPLTLADWQFTPLERPPCPPPWTSYLYLQYSDSVMVPGIGAKVDADIYLGSETPAPAPPPVHLDPLPVVLGSDGDFRLVEEIFGTDVRYVVVAKHSSEGKLKKAGYI